LKVKGLPNVFALAHYSKGYDSIFILKTLFDTESDEALKKPPTVIQSSGKIIMVEYQNMRFTDTFSFFGTPLRNLPKTFGLPEPVKKGWFPFLFVTEDNLNYVGELPAAEYFDPDGMNAKENKQFVEWYATELKKQKTFDLWAELVAYCEQDVRVLRMACASFEKLFFEKTGIRPLANKITIASTCMTVFLRLFYEPGTIGLVPRRGYRWTNPTSKAALEWLAYRQSLLGEGQVIQHAGNSRELKIGKFHVDGFLPPNTVLDYYGCVWHGCRACYPVGRRPTQRSMPDLEIRYQHTIKREEILRKQGYELVTIWGCEHARLKQSTPEAFENLETYSEPLQPRDAFFGGRTTPFKLLYDVKGTEKIMYKDFTSLYPYINKTATYPVSHPDVYVNDDCPNVRDVLGLVKCVVLPPRSLYLPVLPMHGEDGKLLFVLCRTCALTLNQESCTHSDDERELTGTWVSTELQAALDRGYVVKRVFEVWDYKKSARYDPETRSGGLFAGYVNTFIKGKAEASGWPDQCVTEEEKRNYIEEFYRAEGVRLDPENIENNPGLRAIYKSLLNNFWGKFGQRSDLRQTVFVSDFEELLELHHRPGTNNPEYIPVGPEDRERIMASFQPQASEAEAAAYVSPVIAAFTTANARLKLLSAMETVGRDILYVDTDSIIYVTRDNSDPLPVGVATGEFTSEVGAGVYIEQFCAGGPKNYSYKTNTGETGIKTKGVTITAGNKDLITHEALRNLVIVGGSVSVAGRQIRRTKDLQVVTIDVSKEWQVCHTKRRVVGRFDTLPFGYVD